MGRPRARETGAARCAALDPLNFLRAVYMNADLPLSVRMRAAIELLPFTHPKRIKRMEQMKVIEAQPTNGEKVDARLPPRLPDRRFRRI